MKIKLKGREELEAMVLIVRLVNSRLIASVPATVEAWCRLRSVDKLLVQLAVKVVRGESAKTTVKLDEMQMATLYEELQECGFPLYELNLVNRIISEIEKEYYNEKGRFKGRS